MKYIKYLLAITCILSIGKSIYATEDEQAWNKVISLAETLIGEGSFWDADGAEEKLDAIVDLQVAFCKEITGKNISSQRVMATKQGMRLFLKTAGERYEGDKRKAILRFLRDLATNRAVFFEILTSNSSSEVIEQQMLAYLERNQGMSYNGPVSISEQISVPQENTPLQIIEEGIRLISDCGTSGHYNKAIDAGEVITINIPLKNISDDPFRSTSGFLQTEDKYVKVGTSEVLYTERSEIDGQTVTFAPDMSITPSQHYVFTVSPECPDKHKVNFTLLAWDSDRGKFEIPFEIVIYNVGPLTFGSAKIDDDIPGRSNGNGNQQIEVGETIEYVLAVRNHGQVNINNVKSTLFSGEPTLIFKTGDDVLQYSSIDSNSEKPISANFVFTVEEDDNFDFSDYTTLRLFSSGESRHNQYSWITVSQVSIRVNDQQWATILSKAKLFFKEGKYKQTEELLTGLHISDQVAKSEEASRLKSEAMVLGTIESSKKKPIYAVRSDSIAENLWGSYWIFNKEKLVKDNDGENHNIKIKLVHYMRENSYISVDIKGNPKPSSFASPRATLTLAVDDNEYEIDFGYTGNDINSRARFGIPFENDYTDRDNFRFVYTYLLKDENIRYYVFVYSLAYGKDGVPTSVEDPETLWTSMNERNSASDSAGPSPKQDFLEVVSTVPQLPAVLSLGQKLVVKIRYHIASADKARIWARPYTGGQVNSAMRGHGSPQYDSGSGVVNGWFFFDEPTKVDEIRVNMVAADSQKTIVTATLKIDAEWK